MNALKLFKISEAIVVSSSLKATSDLVRHATMFNNLNEIGAETALSFVMIVIQIMSLLFVLNHQFFEKSLNKISNVSFNIRFTHFVSVI